MSNTEWSEQAAMAKMPPTTFMRRLFLTTLDLLPKEIDVFSTTMAKLTIKPGGVAPTIISAKISIKVGC